MSIIRPARLDDAPAIARVHVDTWRSTYRGIVPDATLDGLSYERRAERWRANLAAPTNGETTFVAELQGEVVGWVGGGPARGDDSPTDGELWGIYLLKEHQGKGIGRQLFQAMVEHVLQLGHHSMMLWVLVDNPTRGFYDKMGGRPADVQLIEIGGVSIPEIRYIWDDIQTLKEL
jgi:GNAT superfamily N-acetyltransferase